MRTGLLVETLRSLALPVVLLIFTTAYLMQALELGRPLRYGVPSAAFMPLVLSAAMYLALAFVITTKLVDHARRYRDMAELPQSEPISALSRPLLTALATGVYIALFASVGFAIATVAYLFALLSLFGFHDGRTLAGQCWRVAASVAITACIYAFFTGLFKVQLPALDGVI